MRKLLFTLVAVCMVTTACGPDVGTPPEVTSCDVRSGRRAVVELGQTMPQVHVTWTADVEHVSVDGVEVDITAREYVAEFLCGEALLVHFRASTGIVKVANNNPPADDGTRPYLSQWIRRGEGWTLDGYGPVLDSYWLSDEDDMLIAGVTEQNYWWYGCRRTVGEHEWPNTCDSQVEPPKGYTNGNSGPWHVHGGGAN